MAHGREEEEPQRLMSTSEYMENCSTCRYCCEFILAFEGN